MSNDIAQSVTHPPLGTDADRYEAAKLRRAGLEDIAALIALYHRAREESTETQESMSGWLDRGGSLVLQDADGTLVCALRWREGQHGWEVDRVATLPRTRGRSYGRWLMTKLEALAIRSNIPTLNLTLKNPDAELLAYYQRMGYQMTDKNAAHVELQKRVGGVWQYKGRNS